MSNSQEDKIPVVFAAAGSSHEGAEDVFDFVLKLSARRLPGHPARVAFTSELARSKLLERGVAIPSPEEALIALRDEGYSKAAVQSLTVVPGQMHDSLTSLAVEGIEIAIGEPLLSSDRQITEAIYSLATELRPDIVNIMVAHGNSRNPEHNRNILRFAELIENKHPNVFVCSLEGEPGIAKLEKARDMAAGGQARFIPLLITYGKHVREDVMGDSPESWKSIVGAADSTCASCLGYNTNILSIFFRHAEAALNSL